ncbi:16S rRNA processing protein RimM [Neobittarella massiliensis]|uniref:Ribosome maturation factor RimM n=2 Tax=Oscillospiraceae TaxID=216572 RepID=A0A8J6IH69_9FIRM|nr:16S rRNA processing protein RimM [Neobittarella massiliensis]SCJ89656.1 Ribosome maturation factor rimM [uncultured Anaerotruncus sp.]
MKKFLEVGKIVATQGIRGEVRVQPWCDSPAFLLDFDTLYRQDGTAMEVQRARVQKNIVIVKFAGIERIEDGQPYIGTVLYIDRDDAQLPEGSYFVQDLLGLEVYDADTGARYGEVVEVSQTGANDVYHVKDGDKLRLVPAIKEVVLDIDFAGGSMRIRPLEGLFDDAH